MTGPSSSSHPPKPRSASLRPQLARLPALTPARRLARRAWRLLFRLLVRLLARVHITGIHHLPPTGAALLVSNHLGDADVIAGLAFTPRDVDPLAKVELRSLPLVGWMLETYGVIWIHHGQPDRRALRIALQALAEGRLVGIAPEGRESLTGALEEGTGGAAFLALRSGAPLLPITFTGSENRLVFASLRRLRRPAITITVGPPFHLPPDIHARFAAHTTRAQALHEATLAIMHTLARQLPPQYRGVYREQGIGEDG